MILFFFWTIETAKYQAMIITCVCVPSPWPGVACMRSAYSQMWIYRMGNCAHEVGLINQTFDSRIGAGYTVPMAIMNWMKCARWLDPFGEYDILNVTRSTADMATISSRFPIIIDRCSSLSTCVSLYLLDTCIFFSSYLLTSEWE